MLIQDLRLRAVTLDTRAEIAATELKYKHPMGSGPKYKRLAQLERTARVAQDAADAAWRLVAEVEASKGQQFPGSLRDWFAGQAVVGETANGHWDNEPSSDKPIAVWCYQLADSMLAARKPPYVPKEDQNEKAK